MTFALQQLFQISFEGGLCFNHCIERFLYCGRQVICTDVSATSILPLPLSCSSLVEGKERMRLIPQRPPWACSSMGLDRGVAVLISDSLTWCCLARVRKRPKRNSSLCAGKCDRDSGGRYADICGLQHVRRIT
jgi:hypothetical protein